MYRALSSCSRVTLVTSIGACYRLNVALVAVQEEHRRRRPTARVCDLAQATCDVVPERVGRHNDEHLRVGRLWANGVQKRLVDDRLAARRATNDEPSTQKLLMASSCSRRITSRRKPIDLHRVNNTFPMRWRQQAHAPQ